MIGSLWEAPVVDITKPNEAGVSHNVFREYNVDEQGIIYNNNPDQEFTPAHVGHDRLFNRKITINPNLGEGAARVILVEVSGANPSEPKGVTTICGPQADYVVVQSYDLKTCGES